MDGPSDPSARSKSGSQLDVEQLTMGGSTPNAKLHFGAPGMEGNQAPTPKANVNLFANPEVGSNEAERPNKLHVDAMEGWTFQGKKRHTPKLASPRREVT
ncbi:unnamed protein product [Sphagnum jensenii]|uniref:Auxin-responsive protein n=1 Tax=Sphagnum jensenii TaxID=128206 RepID=A0ABP1C162_9BRYO